MILQGIVKSLQELVYMLDVSHVLHQMSVIMSQYSFCDNVVMNETGCSCCTVNNVLKLIQQIFHCGLMDF